MVVDFDAVIKDIRGIPVLESSEGVSLTFRHVATTALLAPTKGGDDLSGPEKMKRFLLAQKIYESKEPCSLMSEDIVLLKTLIAQHFSALIVGRCYELLERG